MRILLIGNSPIEAIPNIDFGKYCHIIRINNYKLGYGMGDKTTIWANGIATVLDKDLSDIEVWGVFPLFTHKSGSKSLLNKATIIPVEFIRMVYDEMFYDYKGFPHPSTGMLTLRYALELGHSVDLFNFSFFKDSVDGTNMYHHYWKADDEFDKSHKYVKKAHHGVREEMYVRNLMKRFDLKIL